MFSFKQNNKKRGKPVQIPEEFTRKLDEANRRIGELEQQLKDAEQWQLKAENWGPMIDGQAEEIEDLEIELFDKNKEIKDAVFFRDFYLNKLAESNACVVKLQDLIGDMHEQKRKTVKVTVLEDLLESIFGNGEVEEEKKDADESQV